MIWYIINLNVNDLRDKLRDLKGYLKFSDILVMCITVIF
jgi:hypothetical protein